MPRMRSRPRNALDGGLAPWTKWAYPCDRNHSGADCAIHFCTAGTQCQGACPLAAKNGKPGSLNASNGQACYWFSNGCTVGCESCDGTTNHVGHGKQQFLFNNMTAQEMKTKNISIPNPWTGAGLTLDPRSYADLNITANCAKPTAKPTLCDPRLRTKNTQAECGSPADVFYWSPWRYPGNAPVIDACGSAGGRFPGQGIASGGAQYQNSSRASQGDLGSNLPALSPQAVVRAGGLLEVGWTVMANHGGGYAYRIAPASATLTEDVFRMRPLDFVGLSALRWDGNRSGELKFNTTERGWETSTGTVPKGSMWRKVPIPTGIWAREGPQFEPVCDESVECLHAARGMGVDLHTATGVCKCSGYANGGPLLPNLEIVDQVRIPRETNPGKWVLQWRWDVRSSSSPLHFPLRNF